IFRKKFKQSVIIRLKFQPIRKKQNLVTMKNFKSTLLTLAVLFILVSFAQSCSNNDNEDVFPVPLKAIVLEGNLEEDQAKVEELRNGILEIAQSIPCTDAVDWKITPLGYKACGGPSGPVSYLAYSSNIDELDFLQLVEVYRLSQKALIEKWGLFSMCELPPVPKDVECTNNQAVLVY
ncbi:MAG: hypothetical protein KDD03_12765, partial [Gelidibacter sp.]|nr:hypothetical protein [Gelidibacter sp.]